MIKMNWKYILKQPEEYPRDEIDRIMEKEGITEEQAKKVYRGRPEYASQLGDPKQEYGISIQSFYDQSWVKNMKSILGMPGYDNLVNAAMEDGANAAMVILNSLIENAGYEQKVKESLERHKESTRLSAVEKPSMEPEHGSAGRGMIPKRTEWLLNTISRMFGQIMEDLMKKTHEAVDKEIGPEVRIRIEEVLEDKRIDPDEVEKVWKTTIDDIVTHSVDEAVNIISETVDISMGGAKGRVSSEVKNKIKNDIVQNSDFKSWAVHVYAMVSTKIRGGMASLSEDPGEEWLGDVMTDEEKEWFKTYSERSEMELGPGMKVEGTKPPPLDPQFDPSLGIPKGKLWNPDVGEMSPAKFKEWQEKIERENKAFMKALGKDNSAFLKAWRIIKSNRCCRPKRGILDDFY